MFVYNQQVTDSLTRPSWPPRTRDGIPVVGVYETMPSRAIDYQTWMLAEVDALERAVAEHVSTEKLMSASGAGAERGRSSRCRDVDVRLSGRKILDDVSFSSAPGEFTGLIGSNGAGKTTLLRVILGLQAPSAGQVLLAGRPRSRRSPLIGYVPQKFLLDPDMPLRARDLVGLGLDGHRLGIPRPSRRATRLVDEMLDAVDASRFADTRVGRLSGGEQQRVLIAHALIARPTAAAARRAAGQPGPAQRPGGRRAARADRPRAARSPC